MISLLALWIRNLPSIARFCTRETKSARRMVAYLSSLLVQQAATEDEEEQPAGVVKRGEMRRARMAASTRPVVRPRAVRGLLTFEERLGGMSVQWINLQKEGFIGD